MNWLAAAIIFAVIVFALIRVIKRFPKITSFSFLGLFTVLCIWGLAVYVKDRLYKSDMAKIVTSVFYRTGTATLTINGHKVTVDDSFHSLSPELQKKTVEEIAAQLGIKPSMTIGQQRVLALARARRRRAEAATMSLPEQPQPVPVQPQTGNAGKNWWDDAPVVSPSAHPVCITFDNTTNKTVEYISLHVTAKIPGHSSDVYEKYESTDKIMLPYTQHEACYRLGEYGKKSQFYSYDPGKLNWFATISYVEFAN